MFSERLVSFGLVNVKGSLKLSAKQYLISCLPPALQFLFFFSFLFVFLP